MGRKKKKHQDGHGRGNKDNPRQTSYEDLIRENGDFEKYYKAQNLVSSENEWRQMVDCLKKDLPSAFRITSGLPETKFLLETIQGKYFQDLLKDSESTLPLQIPWYPDGLAWQLDMSRVKIRKFQEYKRLHQFLIGESENGTISRQETVSMIPPLLLDILPGQRVLDMCAAPGSKTAQIIELLHQNETKVPSGLIVANDVDNKRCYMLMHQAKRLRSSCLMVTNHDASQMPNVVLGNGEVLKYDRVLCDAPCSGDGTLRKNGDIWRKWNTANANSLHGLQVRIARRGLELLAVGGVMVYSTCSLNPVENEAIVCRLLKDSEGAVELIDVRDKLRGLKVNPGLHTWKVASKDVELFDTFDQVPESARTLITAKMFPPSSKEMAGYHIERCLRILPHKQDTGAFFVAVFRKVKLLPSEAHKVKTSIVENNVSSVGSAAGENAQENCIVNSDAESVKRKLKKLRGFKENPYIFLDPTDKSIIDIKSFYGLTEDFPSAQLLCRCAEGVRRNLYLVSEQVKDVMTHNADRLKVINMGVRVFSRNEGKGDLGCDFRVAQDGLSTMLPYIGEARKLRLNLEDITVILRHEFPLECQYSSELRQTINDMPKGCVIIIYESGTDANKFDVTFSARLGQATLRCYIAKQERPHYLRLCGLDDSLECESTLERDKNKPLEEKNGIVMKQDSTMRLDDIAQSNKIKLENEEKRAEIPEKKAKLDSSGISLNINS